VNLEAMTRERDILMAALQEICERHEPFLDVLGIEQCGQCSLRSHYYVSYPCPDVGTIRTAMKELRVRAPKTIGGLNPDTPAGRLAQQSLDAAPWNQHEG
jgi:hypothetical protein